MCVAQWVRGCVCVCVCCFVNLFLEHTRVVHVARVAIRCDVT